MMRAPALLLLAALAATPLASAWAQVSDPTAPPAALRQSAQRGAGTAAAPQPAAPRLQSVLVSPQRRVAVIDGETVRLGQKHRGAVLARVSPTEVELVRGNQREVLKLYPRAGRPARQ